LTVPSARANDAVSPSSALPGVALMLLGMFLFSANDVLGKWLVSTYSVGQVLLIRSAVALVVLIPFLWRVGLASLIRIERPGLQTVRMMLSAAEVACFYSAVRHMPLADAMTYWLAAPIYVAALSPFLLGERVGWRRWSAITVGFVGVIVALEPSSATFGPSAAYALAGSLSFALMMVTGRSLRGTPDAALVSWQIVGALVFGAVVAPAEWVPPTGPDLLLLGLLGIVSMAAHVCVNRSLKLAPAATVTPFQYTLLLWAIIFGWTVFGDVPRTAVMTGAAIIVAAGLYIFFREQKLRR
jgi:drug/metabolite transporter (DMT)-like permease